MGARLKNLPARLQKKIINLFLYQPLTKGVKSQTIQLEEPKQRLILSHSEKRSYKAKQDRLKANEKLCKKLSKCQNPQSLVSNYGYKKYFMRSSTQEYASKIYQVIKLNLSTQLILL